MRRAHLSQTPPTSHAPVARARFRREFPGAARVFLAVVRPVVGLQAALRAVHLARTYGADGVVVSNRGCDARTALALALGLKLEKPDGWLGLGLKETAVAQTLQFPGVSQLRGLWEEDAGCDTLSNRDYQNALEAIEEARGFSHWEGLHFGGTRAVDRPFTWEEGLRVRSRLASYADVVVCRPPAPNAPLELEGVKLWRRTDPEHPLALFMRHPLESWTPYIPWLDCCLVCEGLESAPGVLDPTKIQEAAAAIHSAPAAPLNTGTAPPAGPVSTPGPQ